MKQALELLVKIALFAFTLWVWSWTIGQAFHAIVNLSIVVGGVLLVFPLVWLGRRLLDHQPTKERADRVTTGMHYALLLLFGAAIVRAVVSQQEWAGWILPVPRPVGWFFVLLAGAATLWTVLILALRGLGAPFAIALSRTLAADWLYAWTRNPMALATLAFLLALGIWFQSALFSLWAVFLVSPALLTFVKVYEERELEIRFGAPYLEYKHRTPMLFPRKPRKE